MEKPKGKPKPKPKRAAKRHAPRTRMVLLSGLFVVLLGAALWADNRTVHPTNLAPPELAGKQIAFTSYRDGRSRVFIMNDDGSNIQPLTDDDIYSFDPTWSPDGQRIAFRTGDNIHVINTDRTGMKRLTSGPGEKMAPAWSPDGQIIAYTVRHDGELEGWLYVMDADGNDPRRISPEGWYASSPSWTPDGSRIMFLVYDGTGWWRIAFINPDGTGFEVLDHDIHYNEYEAAMSPDGTQIVFSTHATALDVVLFIMNADGTNMHQLTTIRASSPTWSPDSTRIAFVHRTKQEGNTTFDPVIIVMNADGTGLIRLTGGEKEDFSPAWRP